jgi:hypothetical protein
MATATQLVEAFRVNFSGAAGLISNYGAIARDGLLADSVSKAAAVGTTIEYKGFGSGSYSYVKFANIFMPTSSARALSSQDAMTYFLFESRNTMRAKQFCELVKNAVSNLISANNFVKLYCEYETRGGLEIGRMWQQIIDRYGTGSAPVAGSISQYYYKDVYLKTPAWETVPSQLTQAINDVLVSKYVAGSDKGLTRQQVYTRDYNDYRTDPRYQTYKTFACSGSNLNLSVADSSNPTMIA